MVRRGQRGSSSTEGNEERIEGTKVIFMVDFNDGCFSISRELLLSSHRYENQFK